MKILQVNTTDLLGSRFNGRDLNTLFRSQGHVTSQCVWIKQGDDDATWRLGNPLFRGYNFTIRGVINIVFTLFERIMSLQSLLYPWGIQLFFDKRFKSADIVHYHLLHNGYFSLWTLPKLTRNKPSIWTIHDPWAMTGHCVYPQDCRRWLEGCGQCPDVKKFIPMLFDNSARMFRIKKKIYEKLDVDLVFASKFMMEMAQASPLFQGMRMHHLPFGVNLEVFKKRDKRHSRERIGVPVDHFVISFRSTTYEYKGLEYIRSALKKFATQLNGRQVTILTVDTNGLLRDMEGDFNVIDLGSVTDESVLAEFYAASDLFLMPSTGEAFGMMAIESMACGTPVIVFEGTSLPDVVFAPYGGVSIPARDADALCEAIIRLHEDPVERGALGMAAHDLAREHYDFDMHAQKIMDLYESVVNRRNQTESI